MLTKQDLKSIEDLLKPRFDQIEKRFDQMDLRISNIVEKVGEHTDLLKDISYQLISMGGQSKRHDANICDIYDRISKIEDHINVEYDPRTRILKDKGNSKYHN
jgi:hypothetical protein